MYNIQITEKNCLSSPTFSVFGVKSPDFSSLVKIPWFEKALPFSRFLSFFPVGVGTKLVLVVIQIVIIYFNVHIWLICLVNTYFTHKEVD